MIGLVLSAVSQPSSAQAPVNFNRDVRPILAENCFFCHGQDPNKREADLRLDVREDAIDYGAIVPGELDESTLVERILAEEGDGLMPPPDSNRQLTQSQKEILKRWISEGAEYKNHWAFEPPQRPDLPAVRNDNWIRNPIDRFVLAKLESEQMPPSPMAEREVLIKRLAIDLTGLPPTPEEVSDFVNDRDPLAYERLVDRMMASEHYGERMALPWLDAARYADSNGFQQDGDTWQWIWRDWVVQAINQDLPFDQFTTWQLAGDLLPNATQQQKIASGFNRNHLLNGEGGAIAEEQRFVVLFDRMDTTATTWLGLTMACAQCHDHKYDPITQRDYYSMMDMFNRVPEKGVPQRQSSRIRVAKPFLELPTEENQKRITEWEQQIKTLQTKVDELTEAAYLGWKKGLLAHDPLASVKGLPPALAKALATPDADRSEEVEKKLQADLRKYFNEKVKTEILGKLPAGKQLAKAKADLSGYRGDQIPRVMIMSDAKPRQTHVLERGEYLKPAEKVSFRTPEFLPPMSEESSRDRLGFAKWLTADGNPLMGRVQMNRLWQYSFGLGIVKTSEDLGVQSEYPLHKDLLDWLAVEFRESGWSMKKMHRLILTSATYRQSSRMTAAHRERDAENRWYSRASRFRMPSMVLRDWALSVSGLLDARVGGQPVYPYQPDHVWETLAITKERDFTYPKSSGSDLYRRSLYTFWRRTVGPANMFDASNRQACRVRPSTTSTPLHALTTLNDPTWVEAARVLARRCLTNESEPEKQIAFAFRRVLCREPTAEDMGHLTQALNKQNRIFTDDPSAAEALLGIGESPRESKLNPVEHAAMTSVCLALLNLDESLTRE